MTLFQLFLQDKSIPKDFFENLPDKGSLGADQLLSDPDLVQLGSGLGKTVLREEVCTEDTKGSLSLIGDKKSA